MLFVSLAQRIVRIREHAEGLAKRKLLKQFGLSRHKFTGLKAGANARPLKRRSPPRGLETGAPCGFRSASRSQPAPTQDNAMRPAGTGATAADGA